MVDYIKSTLIKTLVVQRTESSGATGSEGAAAVPQPKPMSKEEREQFFAEGRERAQLILSDSLARLKASRVFMQTVIENFSTLGGPARASTAIDFDRRLERMIASYDKPQNSAVPDIVARAAELHIANIRGVDSLIHSVLTYNIALSFVEGVAKSEGALNHELETVTDPDDLQALRRISEDMNLFMDKFEPIVEVYPGLMEYELSNISDLYVIEGEIINKNEDGTYGFGVFSVKDKVTGDIYWNHDGGGVAIYHGPFGERIEVTLHT
ncbi:hypothetical protein GCM10007301_26320 [Azorhizobium oxalatiphilum]|uniref:Uncharacterized protein n=1 Tax=Azorhizobium oxalatiphilum TaxID=980631 RepID=A0A917FBK0_9HYPH|nr:hypothetical protein [Azorhizobium oxalatiphilum]GGF65293.1 hypothetical protein GCM10007301_26320 [Azorhizobium oxalatiphilum]